MSRTREQIYGKKKESTLIAQKDMDQTQHILVKTSLGSTKQTNKAEEQLSKER